MFGSKILQMCLEHAEEKIDIVGWLRDFENAFVNLFVRRSGSVLCADLWRIRKRDLQRQFFCDEIDRVQPHGEMLQKTAQHKEKRLGGFNFIFKFKTFLERLRRPNQLEHSIVCSIRALPHPDGCGAKSRPELLLIQRRELPKRMNPPLVQDSDNFLG